VALCPVKAQGQHISMLFSTSKIKAHFLQTCHRIVVHILFIILST